MLDRVEMDIIHMSCKIRLIMDRVFPKPPLPNPAFAFAVAAGGEVFAAFHWNDALKALYQRLVAAGKPHKLALVACARKLIIYANTVVQRDAPWVAKPATI